VSLVEIISPEMTWLSIRNLGRVAQNCQIMGVILPSIISVFLRASHFQCGRQRGGFIHVIRMDGFSGIADITVAGEFQMKMLDK
jgi:hypothetical protein